MMSTDGMTGPSAARWAETLERLRGLPLGRLLGGAVIAGASLAFGLALAMLGARFGAPTMLLLPLGAGLSLLVFLRPAWALVAIFLSLPAGFLSLPTDELGLQGAEVVVVLVIGLVVARRLVAGAAPLTWRRELWLAAALLVWALVSSSGALDTTIAAKQTAQIAGGLSLSLVALSSLRGRPDTRTVLGVLMIVSLGMIAFGLGSISELRTKFGGAVGVGRAAGVFPHPNDYGAVAAITLMLTLSWLFAGRTRASRLGAAAGSVVALVGLAVSLSRGAWVGALAGVLVLLALLPRARRALFVVGVPAAIAGALLVSTVGPSDQPQVQAVQRRVVSITEPTSNPYDDRPLIYEEALRQIRDRPLAGVGPGNFPIASARASSRARSVGASHAHNVLLTVGAELGAPGIGLVVAFTVVLGLAALRAARETTNLRDRAVVAGVAAALAIAIGQGLVDFTLRNAVVWIAVWSLAGILLVLRRAAADPARSEEGAWIPESGS